MTAVLFLLALAVGPAGPASDRGGAQLDILAYDAAQAFEDGVKLRHDSAAARPRFREAARMYDELWWRGCHNPDLALNRANAHRLAGDLPRAIVAINEGLEVARWSRPLQVALEDARAAVGYPVHSDLAAKCRPMPPTGISMRMSPAEAWGIAALLWLMACAGIARFVMARAPGWLAFAGGWLAALALLGGFWLQDHRHRERENEYPRVVVADDVFLRKGNADSFPVRLEGAPKIPRGVEARELTRRGGWVQIQLAGGVAGWIPASSVLKIDG